MGVSSVIEAELTWTGRGFEPGVRIAIGRDGRIDAVERGAGPAARRRLRGRALLPGMVNAHSHAFQRGLRGRTEHFGRGAGSFWTWRESMYELAAEIDEASMYDLSRSAFSEMLDAGITTVGEFHYLHHDRSCRGFALDEAVLRAAADAGIRIVLLETLYRTGGIGRPLEQAQRRFAAEPHELWAQVDRIGRLGGPPTRSIGVAAHSIRAVDIPDLVALHAEAARRGLPFHMHVEEQPAEIEQCLAAHGARPMALLAARLPLDDRFTAVHCTHTAGADLDAFLSAGGNVCICPLTEAGLGDGVPDVPRILARGGRICLGTDSNARIDFGEEMRWLEYAQRLALLRRGVCTDESGSCAAAVFRAATVNGARALRVSAGEIAPGAAADLLALDLDAPGLAGWTPETLLDSFVFGSGREAIAEVCVAGRWRRTG